MINLFENYTQRSWDLHYSLIVAGFDNATIALKDDGFLPSDVQSPYAYYLGFKHEKASRPLYFNELSLPDYWEIKANNDKGEVFNLGQKKAHIHFSFPTYNRFIKSVDWLGPNGKVQLIDHYNQFGFKFAETLLNSQGQVLKTSYYNRLGQEIMTENQQTDEWILNWQGQVYFFNSKRDFVNFYLKDAGFTLERIVYNSLSTPFSVSYNLKESGSDLLFWQESIQDSLPWNMRLLLQDQHRNTKILVQDHESYLKMQPLLTEREKTRVQFLGYMYPFKNDYAMNRQALILTNSDHLEQLEELVQSLPQLHFHIGAITNMSNKLKDFDRYQNVTLYPNIAMTKVSQLLQDTSIYLDINYGKEILSAIRAAFENNLLLYAFYPTLHNQAYLAADNCYQPENVKDMVVSIQKVINDEQQFLRKLAQQREAAFVASPEQYQAAINELK